MQPLTHVTQIDRKLKCIRNMKLFLGASTNKIYVDVSKAWGLSNGWPPKETRHASLKTYTLRQPENFRCSRAERRQCSYTILVCRFSFLIRNYGMKAKLNQKRYRQKEARE